MLHSMLPRKEEPSMLQVPDDVAWVAKPLGLVEQCSSLAPYSDANLAFGPSRQATLILVEVMGVRYAGES